MHFYSKLVLTVLVTLPSILAAKNGKCSGRSGICIATGTCTSRGGSYVTGKCPNDPNDIKCCDDIPCSDNGVTGKCMFTNECSGRTVSGKCPGGNDFKCCIQKSPTGGSGTSCSYEGLKGTCKNVKDCNGFNVSGLCPGGNDIKCCLPKNSCKGMSGSCLPVGQCSKTPVAGKCPGGKNIQCCPDGGNGGGKKFKYFTISELLKSDTASKYGIKNQPNATQRSNLEYLITNCLDPIREIYGKPIRVTSGFRSEALNKKVGGSSTSQHKSGQAADLVPVSGSIRDLYEAIVKFGDYDQFIIENKSWAHVSCRSSPRRKILYYNGKSYVNVSKSNYKNYI